MNTLEAIYHYKIIAIIRGAKKEDLLQIGAALKEGGVRLIEVTLNSPGAIEGIKQLKEAFGEEMKVGAGTVLDPESAKAAMDAGADFILSPTVSKDTIKITKRYGKVSIPGAFTPTEILTAYEEGADLVKVFPASIGAAYIKDIRGPLSHIPLVPTGGVNKNNITDFQKAGAVAFGIGSSLVNTKEEVNETYLGELTNNAQAFIEAVSTK
ncbi:bifunctional 4-hydroxy-2-oxoglutarate aldolase/2-dehydro-3-deoxy-phosphogluconate aldolase [Oceanobacillus jeddahense]|uniref:Bifunctional 4-hydroxy-2-oxoglutarate aldolase/2-dehydro-3-deoxy-phosphogluconate aldolase n=1 Tax=Oceanobacillus jeddahense TaxID=1462527 RepID=A0ABY5JVZ8_9BACI|nr:bifunctional 4-hydroxy-2-oxoglutarate aldolase/2-dehydro-3-deoxy-phosphogluconate aldolase [Oceanobacillus jeddahense]UUI04246.1 bifunctional 4-hydroxy-2-oxoglutarate aldolase/2-dehydro-3-deoxy-phosphogluconate aldolase [Oceanobacillus jeddahense]